MNILTLLLIPFFFIFLFAVIISAFEVVEKHGLAHLIISLSSFGLMGLLILFIYNNIGIS